MFFDSMSTKHEIKVVSLNIEQIKRETELKEEVEASGGRKGAGAWHRNQQFQSEPARPGPARPGLAANRTLCLRGDSHTAAASVHD